MRRDVDYCSGAALAVRRTLFESLGGLDERYAPAYYEDTDLCFAARAAGYRVVVQPESVVTHVEGASNGRDDAGGLKRFQEVNRVAFAHKWRDVLPAHGEHRSAADVWVAANRSSAGMALVVEPVLPTPDRDSGSRRMAALLDEMRALGLSVYYAVGEHVTVSPYRQQLERRGVTVLESAGEQRRFLEEAGSRLRLVVLCRPGTAWKYLDDVYRWAPQATLVYDTVDLHGLRLHRQAVLEDDPSLHHIARLMWIKERAVMRAADVTLVVSDVERELLARTVPDAEVRVLSNIHEPVVAEPALAGRGDIVFVGGYLHPPNVDAARWMVDEIMPMIWSQEPRARLVLIGSFMPPEIERLSSPRIEARGWVPDLATSYAGARVVVAPLRFGAGVKGKVAEAIEYGVPLVGTSIALEGVDFVDGRDVICADDAQAFADAVVRLMRDDELWLSMAGRGQDVLRRQFSPARAREVLEDILSHRCTRVVEPDFEHVR